MTKGQPCVVRCNHAGLRSTFIQFFSLHEHLFLRIFFNLRDSLSPFPFRGMGRRILPSLYRDHNFLWARYTRYDNNDDTWKHLGVIYKDQLTFMFYFFHRFCY